MGWIKQTFSKRYVAFLKMAWNSLLQPHLDYGLVLVCPFLKGEKKEYEKPLRNFTKMAYDCKEMNYWQRLSHFKLFSSERRIERYRVTYISKSLNGLVPSRGLTLIKSGTRSGWHLIGPEGRIRTLHRNSIN